MTIAKATQVNLHGEDGGVLTQERLEGCLNRYSQGKVLIIGDIMLDKYLHGDAERVSPEAPVPVVLVEKETEFIGGAGNVARNIRALGGTPVLLGVRGADNYGATLELLLSQSGVEFDFLVTANRPTTVKLRVLARKQQMLRIDWEDSTSLAQGIAQELLAKVKTHLEGVGAIVISDYGKGIVSEEFFTGLHAMLNEMERSIPLLVDPKPQNTKSYAGVTLLTPNAKETGAMAGARADDKEAILKAGKVIMEQLGCPYLVTTLGADGMAVFCHDASVWHIPTSAQQVFDVTGAGDTVIGAIALGLASGADLVESAILANYGAGIVVGQVGAATASVDAIKKLVREAKDYDVSRWA